MDWLSNGLVYDCQRKKIKLLLTIDHAHYKIDLMIKPENGNLFPSPNFLLREVVKLNNYIKELENPFSQILYVD